MDLASKIDQLVNILPSARPVFRLLEVLAVFNQIKKAPN